jgi:hypothetical protein
VPRSEWKIHLPATGISGWMLWLVVLAGTLIRFCYGSYAHPWFIAPDQLAWQMGLDEMLRSRNWSFLQMGHAPHEGGSSLVGMVSILFGGIKTALPPLSLAALLLDTLIRFFQIKTAQQLFGSATAFWFACWSVLSVPLLLPWSVVNFGLHYLASVFPFIFFWLLLRFRDHRYFGVYIGICIALAISVAYENCLLLIPAISVLLRNTNKRPRSILQFTFMFILFLLPHLLFRSFANTGYPFENGIISGRLLDISASLHPKHLLTLWFTVLPASFLINSTLVGPIALLEWLVFFCIIAGIAFFIKNNNSKLRWLFPGFVLLVLLVYAISPFSAGGKRSYSFAAYRHLAYIIPFLVLLMIDGFVRSHWKHYWLAAWLLICGTASVAFMRRTYVEEQTAYRAAGWILVQKYGINISQLFRLQNTAAPEYHRSIAAGFGWGLATAMLRQPGDSATVFHLRSLIRQSPPAFQDDMLDGVGYAFTPGITPKLPPASLQIFNAQ